MNIPGKHIGALFASAIISVCALGSNQVHADNTTQIETLIYKQPGGIVTTCGVDVPFVGTENQREEESSYAYSADDTIVVVTHTPSEGEFYVQIDTKLGITKSGRADETPHPVTPDVAMGIAHQVRRLASYCEAIIRYARTENSGIAHGTVTLNVPPPDYKSMVKSQGLAALLSDAQQLITRWTPPSSSPSSLIDEYQYNLEPNVKAMHEGMIGARVNPRIPLKSQESYQWLAFEPK